MELYLNASHLKAKGCLRVGGRILKTGKRGQDRIMGYRVGKNMGGFLPQTELRFEYAHTHMCIYGMKTEERRRGTIEGHCRGKWGDMHKVQ